MITRTWPASCGRMVSPGLKAWREVVDGRCKSESQHFKWDAEAIHRRRIPSGAPGAKNGIEAVGRGGGGVDQSTQAFTSRLSRRPHGCPRFLRRDEARSRLATIMASTAHDSRAHAHAMQARPTLPTVGALHKELIAPLASFMQPKGFRGQSSLRWQSSMPRLPDGGPASWPRACG